MKKLSNLFAALVFASLVIFMSCGGDDGGDSVDPLQDELDNLTVAGGFSNPTTVNTDGVAADAGTGTWDNFEITFTGTLSGGTYTVSGVPDGFSDVWANGTWSFNDDGSVINKVQNNVMTAMDAVITDSQLRLEFDVTESTARTTGISGEWLFVFDF